MRIKKQLNERQEREIIVSDLLPMPQQEKLFDAKKYNKFVEEANFDQMSAVDQ